MAGTWHVRAMDPPSPGTGERQKGAKEESLFLTGNAREEFPLTAG